MTTMKGSKEENGTQNPRHEEEETKKKKKDICSKLNHVNNALVQCFYSFGYQVGLRPFYFIVIPFILSVVLSTGLLFIEYEENPLVLFIPFTAPFIREQKIVEEHFPMNYTHLYSPIRFTRHEGHSRVIISAEDGGSIFRSFMWPEIMELDEKLRNISIEDRNTGETLYYKDMCAKWLGKCMDNLALNINEIVGEIENGTTVINYPMMIVPFIVPQVLGGAIINESANHIEDAKAIMVAYFLEIDTSEKIERSYDWEAKVIDFLHNYDTKNIHLSYFASRSLGDELKIKMDSCIPFIPLTGFIMITACMVLLWMSDCVRSKSLIGLVGIISSTMSTGAAFGFLVYCGTTYTRLNVVALFLVLGIGVDDIFVAISAWQKTSMKDSVPKRLAQTYADAAVSVTITSLTNALAFAVGTSTATLIVEAFCLYSCVTIIFAYFFFVTFCGGFLAIAGYMEEQGRHSLFIVKVKDVPEESSLIKKKFYSIFCASSSQGKNTTKEEENHSHVVSVFFRDYVGSLLCNSTFRVFALISLLLYLAGAIYGLTILREGLFRHRMSRDDSYLVEFSHQDDLYFRHMPYSIQVIITGNITYSDPETQEKLLALKQKFESLSYGSETLYTQSWLNSFLRRLSRKKEWQEEITDEVSFIRVLREKYLVNPNNQLRLDLEFNEDYSRIIASRMILQAANVKDVYDDVIMMNAYRKVAEESEFNVTCFHLLFSLFDQHSMMRPLAIQSILIAVVVVVFVALLFIPDILGSIAIACSILSIATGVIGYMAFWNINMDHVSAGSIFMCIGFSVDFSAHITYTYLSSKKETSEEKIKESMHSLGLPILQGGFTTILSLVSFLFIPGYGYRTFFKTIFLVTIFAAYHSIILIPLMLSILEGIRSKCLETDTNISSKDAKEGTNGALKIGNLKSQNRDEKETVIGIAHRKTEDDLSYAKHVHINGFAIGDAKKIENYSNLRENVDEEKGVDNEAYCADELK